MFISTSQILLHLEKRQVYKVHAVCVFFLLMFLSAASLKLMSYLQLHSDPLKGINETHSLPHIFFPSDINFDVFLMQKMENQGTFTNPQLL